MRIFGIDPGSVRTGYGCVERDGRGLRLVTCGGEFDRSTRHYRSNVVVTAVPA